MHISINILEEEQPWCSTWTDSSDQHMSGYWGFCAPLEQASRSPWWWVRWWPWWWPWRWLRWWPWPWRWRIIKMVVRKFFSGVSAEHFFKHNPWLLWERLPCLQSSFQLWLHRGSFNFHYLLTLPLLWFLFMLPFLPFKNWVSFKAAQIFFLKL